MLLRHVVILLVFVLLGSCVRHQPPDMKVKINVGEVKLIPEESALNYLKSVRVDPFFSEVVFYNKYFALKQKISELNSSQGFSRVRRKEPAAQKPRNINYSDLAAVNARSEAGSNFLYIYNNDELLFKADCQSESKESMGKKIISALVSLGAKKSI